MLNATRMKVVLMEDTNKESNKENNFFEKHGLEVVAGDVEVGNTYPIYGMITKILDDTPGQVVVQLNFNIEASMCIPDQSRIEILKQRAFEPGIFVSKITSKENGITVECTTVVFGKRQAFQA